MRAPKFSLWPGSNVFLCGGRCVLGPKGSVMTLSMTVVLIVLPAAIFMAFVTSRWYAQLTVTAAALLALDLIALISVVTTEPGILPRAPEPVGRNMPAVIAVMANGRPTNLRYCSTCHIYRTPKSAHCSVCDNCIENFDHHCSWVGTCVGRRNYRYFLVFVVITFILAAFVVLVSFFFMWDQVGVSWTKGDNRGWLDIVLDQPGATAVFLFGTVFGISLGALLIFHCYLLCIGKTTREQLKALGQREGNWCSNLSRHLCTDQQASRLDVLRLGQMVDIEDGATWESIMDDDMIDEPTVISAQTMAAQLDRRNQGLTAPLLASTSWHVNASMQPPSPRNTSCCFGGDDAVRRREAVPMLATNARAYGAVGVQPLASVAKEDEDI